MVPMHPRPVALAPRPGEAGYWGGGGEGGGRAEHEGERGAYEAFAHLVLQVKVANWMVP